MGQSLLEGTPHGQTGSGNSDASLPGPAPPLTSPATTAASPLHSPTHAAASTPPSPCFVSSLYEVAALTAGGSLAAAAALCSGRHHLAVHLDGGRHHARKAAAAGFCYVNDAVGWLCEMLAGAARVLCAGLLRVLQDDSCALEVASEHPVVAH